MTEEFENLFFVDVGDSDELSGRAFDGLVSGSFVDMLGSAVKITKKDLADFVKNTKEAIEATRTESGELVGLPIDPHDHDRGDAAGWIVDVALENNVVRFTPKWTQIGIDLIQNGKKRFFSATLNLKNKVILGGTLTNWPATRDSVGKILLRPIELSMTTSNWVAGDQTLDSSNWSTTAGNSNIYITAAEVVEPAEDAGNEQSNNIIEGENEMTLDLTMEELQDVIKQTVGDVVGVSVNDAITAAMANITQPEPEGEPGDADKEPMTAEELLAMFDLQGEPEKIIEALNGQMLKQYDVIKDRAARSTAQMIARIKHEDDVSEFVEQSTTGTQSIPRGLPVEPEGLKKFALSLNPEQYKYFAELVESTLDRGFVEFAELGHGKNTAGSVELPAEYAKLLDNKEIELSDLTNPIVAPDLGDLAQYDLSKWQVKA